jgi:GST-like protein
MYTLYHCRGCGSTVVQVALALAGATHRLEDVTPWEPGAATEALRAHNPLVQVPTLLLPSGEVMTESVAILAHLVEQFPDAGLAPPLGSDDRARMWRWLAFLASNVYGPIAVGDHPEQWMPDHHEPLKAGAVAMIERAWRILEENARAPYLTGEHFSILDVYAAMMSHWRPRRAWVDANCPKVSAALQRAEAQPVVAGIFAANF